MSSVSCLDSDFIGQFKSLQFEFFIVLHVTPPFLMIFYHHLVDLTTALKCYYSTLTTRASLEILLGSWGEVQTLTLYSTGVKVLRVYQFHHPAIIPYPKTLFISEVKPIWYSPILAARFS